MQRSGGMWRGQGECEKVRGSVERSGGVWRGQGECGEFGKTREVG